VATVVVQGLSPTATSRREQEVHVALAEIGPQDFKRVTWRGESVLVLGGDEPRAFRIPYDRERRIYLMPDRSSWTRAIIPCTTIVLVDGVLRCAALDDFPDGLRCRDPLTYTTFAWQRADGASLNAPIPNLTSQPYVIREGHLILGRIATD
jgi:hypothetical protein